MNNGQNQNDSIFQSVLNQGTQVMKDGVTINVAFDYVSTAYLALAIFVGILLALVSAKVISNQIIQE